MCIPEGILCVLFSLLPFKKEQINQLHFTSLVEKEKEEEKEKETNLQDEIKVRSQIYLPALNFRIFITMIFKRFSYLLLILLIPLLET